MQQVSSIQCDSLSPTESHSPSKEDRDALERLEQSINEPKKVLARAFLLDGNNEWMTVATGEAISEKPEDGNTLNISLHEEIDGEATDQGRTIFSATFHAHQEIIRQQPTVITWTATDGTDVALSFENEQGCDVFWVEICRFLGKPLEYTIPEEMITDASLGEREMDGEGSFSRRTSGGVTVKLPEDVEFDTIPDIDEAIAAAQASSGELRREVAQTILQRHYVGKLLDLFRIAEDLDSRETLFRLYGIFKNLVLFNNPNLLREILSEANVILVAGVFEHDPQYPDAKPGYRNFLLDRDRFQPVLPLDNAQLLELIHQTFRLQYMKDVVLPRILDEETFGALLFMTRCNFAEIIELLEREENILSKLLPLFRKDAEIDPSQVLKFIKEFLTIAKTSAAGRPLRIYQEVAFEELLQFLQHQLASERTEIRSLAVEVLICITQHDVTAIRHFMIESKRRIPMNEQLLCRLIDRVIDERAEVGLRWQIVAILRTLLDTGITLGIALPSDDFLNFFYPDYALRIFSPLASLDQKKAINININCQATIDIYYNCIDLLCSFIVQHKYRMKYLFFRPWIVTNALNLTKSPPKTLRLLAVRLIRTMIGTGDEFYYRVLIKQNLFRPLVELAITLNTSDNALVSALRELFQHVMERRIKMLVFHLVETLKLELEGIRFALIGKDLQLCYENLLNPQSSNLSSEVDRPSTNGRFDVVTRTISGSHEEIQTRNDDPWGRVDAVEEAYFDSFDDEGPELEPENEREEEVGEEEEGGEKEEKGEKVKIEANEMFHTTELTNNEYDHHHDHSNDSNSPSVPHSIVKAPDSIISPSPGGLTTTVPTGDSIDRNKRMKY